MTRKELDKIQATVKSSSTDTPWKQWPERQSVKTVIKRLAKLLPSSTDDKLQKAVALDNLSEAGKLKMDKSGNIIDGEVVDEISDKTKAEIAAASNRSELMAILAALPIKSRKAATALVNDRVAELAAAKKAATSENATE
jgi:recombinational DNA repair protein RecT